VRVVGNSLEVTFHLKLRPAPKPLVCLERTTGVWGHRGQSQIASLRVGIVGLGSVGSVVCELLARMGIQDLTIIDFDRVEELNLDRILNANPSHLGHFKVDVARAAAEQNHTASSIQINSVAQIPRFVGNVSSEK
jgi:tRNA A37 threonylcarbamoyladenosine dehydratase